MLGEALGPELGAPLGEELGTALGAEDGLVLGVELGAAILHPVPDPVPVTSISHVVGPLLCVSMAVTVTLLPWEIEPDCERVMLEQSAKTGIAVTSLRKHPLSSSPEMESGQTRSVGAVKSSVPLPLPGAEVVKKLSPAAEKSTEAQGASTIVVDAGWTRYLVPGFKSVLA